MRPQAAGEGAQGLHGLALGELGRAHALHEHAAREIACLFHGLEHRVQHRSGRRARPPSSTLMSRVTTP